MLFSLIGCVIINDCKSIWSYFFFFFFLSNSKSFENFKSCCKEERKKENTFLDFTSFVCHYDNFCGWSQTCRISDLKRYLLRKRKTIHWSNGLAFLFAYSCGIRTNWTERNRVWFCFSRMNLFKWQYQKAKLN